MTAARWVESSVERSDIDRGKAKAKVFVTSSGVSAGGDAALGILARLGGVDRARAVARRLEWTWHEDRDSDPFSHQQSQQQRTQK